MAARSETTTAYGNDLVALTNGAHADGVNLGACSDRRRVDMRSTFRAKRLWPLVAAFGGLDVDFRFAREQPESVFSREGVHAECRAGERLAVSAIAEQGLVRLDLGFKGDVPAMTTPVDFHLNPPKRVYAQAHANVLMDSVCILANGIRNLFDCPPPVHGLSQAAVGYPAAASCRHRCQTG